ncbi:TIR domain-containing protein [Streptomyces sp. NPDC002889]|uniref:nSTAND1 domain-containing NTPase n=1 Tax=Streptomyces sp. NPDC002889 TaxID=3364669 RepID=UPI0036930413
MASLFISHSSRDRVPVADMVRRLRAEGFEAVFVDHDPDRGIPAGCRWEPALYAALERADAVLFLGTEHSVESRWCFAELAFARAMGKPLFPVRVAEGVGHPLIHDVQWVDAVAEGEAAYGRLWSAMRRRGLGAEDSFDWDPGRPPYPGLSAYRPEDAAVFFGRSDLIRDLLGRIATTLGRQGRPFVAVVGPSGCGKSSLVRAGLVPRLRRPRQGWLVLEPFVPGARPVTALARALAVSGPRGAADRAAVERQLRESPEEFGEVVRDLVASAAGPGTPACVLLVVDQAEQLLRREETGGPAERERRAFIDILRHSPRGEPAVRVVSTLRSEFLGPMAADPELIDLVHDPVVVGPLERSRLAEVIEGPARRAGLRYEPGLVQRMAEDTRGGDALPLLGYALQQLYERHGPDSLVTTASYDGLGGVAGALRRRADETLAALREAGHGDAVIPTLLRLVAVDDHDEPLGRPLAKSGLAPAERAVLSAFTEARLLVSDSTADGGAAAVRVAHETLLRAWPPLREAIAASRDDLRTRAELERLARDWDRAGRQGSYLLRSERLRTAEAWTAGRTTPPTALVREFLDCSHARDQASLRRAADLLAGRVLADLEDDPQRAVVLSLAAIEEYPPTPRTRYALDRAVRTSRLTGLMTGHTGPVNSVAYAPDGTTLATASDDGTARLWSVDERRELLVLEGHTGQVCSAEYAPGGDRVVTASADGTAIVHRTQDGKAVLRLKTGEEVQWAAFSPDGTRIATLTRYGDLTLWDALDGSRLHVLFRGPAGFTVGDWRNRRSSVAFSPDGDRVAAGSFFPVADVWQGAACAEPRHAFTLRGHAMKSVHTAVFSPDGTRVVTAGGDGFVGLWDAATGERTGAVRPPGAGAVYCARFSPDGTRIVAAAQDGTARLLDAADPGRQLFALGVHGCAVLTAAFSPDGRQIATGGEDGMVRLWHTAQQGVRLRIPHDAPVYCARYSPDGRLIVTASGRTATVWDAASGARLLTAATHHDTVMFATFSPDASWIATASADYTAGVWNAADGARVSALWGHDCPVQSVAFSPDGALVASCAGGRGMGGFPFGSIKIWTADSGTERVGIRADDDKSVLCTAWSPDGTRVVSAMGDCTVCVWDAADGRRLLTLTGHTDTVAAATFSPDGRRVAGASYDGTARVWDAVSGQALFTLDGQGYRMGSVAYSPDGSRMVTASADGVARVWDAADGARLTDLPHPAGLIWAEFSPDGTQIVTAGEEGVATVWRYDTAEQLIALARTRVFRPPTDAERQEYGLPTAPGATPAAP